MLPSIVRTVDSVNYNGLNAYFKWVSLVRKSVGKCSKLYGMFGTMSSVHDRPIQTISVKCGKII